jgi:hypothetical protein
LGGLMGSHLCGVVLVGKKNHSFVKKGHIL